MPADFADTARRAIAACRGKDVAEQARLLAADGLLGVCAGEDVGGLGLPVAFAVPVARAAGAALLSFPLIETLLLTSTLGSGFVDQASPIVAGEEVATVAWQGAVAVAPEGGGCRASGAAARAPVANASDVILVRAMDGRGIIVDASAPGVSMTPSHGLDVVLPEFVVRLEAVSLESSRIVPTDHMGRIDRIALILRAAALVGASEVCLAAAQEHATNRQQFDKPLIANQAIRHHLARQKLALESALTVLDRAIAPGALLHTQRSAFAAAVAAGVAIAEGAIQIHGGMGFTWDTPLHFHLRHIRALEAQGDAGLNLDRLAESYLRKS
jgi:alkylation response protein AidB-like acyl-CoA dehydrogenase